MGTHPIFESDFDCLTEWPISTFKAKKSKLRTSKQLSRYLLLIRFLISREVLEKSQKLRTSFLSIRTYLNKIREDVKNSPALEHLKETQELEFKVLSKQLEMKKALIDRYSNHKLTEEIDLLTEEL